MPASDRVRRPRGRAQTAEHVAAVRSLIGEIVGAPGGCGDNPDTPLDAMLIKSWAKRVNDPDADIIYEWLTEGSPAGIEREVIDPGIFPKAENAAELEDAGFDRVWGPPCRGRNPETG